MDAIREITPPSKGRVIDHISFEVKDNEAFCKILEERGVKLDALCESRDTGIGTAFFTDPWGVTVERTEGLVARFNPQARAAADGVRESFEIFLV